MISFGAYTVRPYTWTTFKAVLALKGGTLLWDDDGTLYTIYMYDNPEVHVSNIWKGVVADGVISGGYTQGINDADKADFEAYFKNAATTNRSIALTVTAPLSQPLNVNVTGAASGLATVIRTKEFSIDSRAEVSIAALRYTITEGKSFYVSFFGGAAFAPLSVILRLKVNGITAIMVLSWQTANNAVALPLAAKIAQGGDVITVTVEAQVPRGQAWAGFTGIEI